MPRKGTDENGQCLFRLINFTSRSENVKMHEKEWTQAEGMVETREARAVEDRSAFSAHATTHRHILLLTDATLTVRSVYVSFMAAPVK